MDEKGVKIPNYDEFIDDMEMGSAIKNIILTEKGGDINFNSLKAYYDNSIQDKNSKLGKYLGSFILQLNKDDPFHWVIQLLLFDRSEFKNTPMGCLYNDVDTPSKVKNDLLNLRDSLKNYLSKELKVPQNELNTYLEGLLKNYLSKSVVPTL